MEVSKEWEFIASIPKDAKPCFNDKTFVKTDEWFVTLKRRYKGEKAEKGIIFLENLIRKSENVDQKLLQRAIIGINNLVYTYKKDGQLEISKNYEECIKKIEKMKKSKNFFGTIPKLVN